ncbi:MAG: hypothetical protein SFX19_08980 [Alphaproteobacteria bacterium]|nr:hypothetical protein [Alphaproteobacteria bacterium]
MAGKHGCTTQDDRKKLAEALEIISPESYLSNGQIAIEFDEISAPKILKLRLTSKQDIGTYDVVEPDKSLRVAGYRMLGEVVDYPDHINMKKNIQYSEDTHEDGKTVHSRAEFVVELQNIDMGKVRRILEEVEMARKIEEAMPGHHFFGHYLKATISFNQSSDPEALLACIRNQLQGSDLLKLFPERLEKFEDGSGRYHPFHIDIGKIGIEKGRDIIQAIEAARNELRWKEHDAEEEKIANTRGMNEVPQQLQTILSTLGCDVESVKRKPGSVMFNVQLASPAYASDIEKIARKMTAATNAKGEGQAPYNFLFTFSQTQKLPPQPVAQNFASAISGRPPKAETFVDGFVLTLGNNVLHDMTATTHEDIVGVVSTLAGLTKDEWSRVKLPPQAKGRAQ